MSLIGQFVLVFHRVGWLFDFGIGLHDANLVFVFNEGVTKEGDEFLVGKFGIPARAVLKQTGSHAIAFAEGSILLRGIGGDGRQYILVRGPGGEVHIPRELVKEIQFSGRIDPTK